MMILFKSTRELLLVVRLLGEKFILLRWNSRYLVLLRLYLISSRLVLVARVSRAPFDISLLSQTNTERAEAHRHGRFDLEAVISSVVQVAIP
jgi:hypothetical protein